MERSERIRSSLGLAVIFVLLAVTCVLPAQAGISTGLRAVGFASPQTLQHRHPILSVLDASNSLLAFGDIGVNLNSVQTVTLTASGNSSIVISNVVISGAGFNASGLPAGTTLPSGQSAAVDVSFTPAVTGIVSGTVTISSNAANSPTVISLTGIGIGLGAPSVTLSWTASTSSVVGYNCYSSIISGGPYTQVATDPVSGTSCADTNVASGQTYYFVVTSVNASNEESGYSQEISTTVP